MSKTIENLPNGGIIRGVDNPEGIRGLLANLGEHLLAQINNGFVVQYRQENNLIVVADVNGSVIDQSIVSQQFTFTLKKKYL